MPQTDRLLFRIGNREIEVAEVDAVPVAIDYALEDAENFEQKKSSTAFNVVLPATLNNSQTFNAPANPDGEDLTADAFFTSHQPCTIEANGVELLKGKAFLVEATHTDRPETITVNCYGNNADWVIDLKEKTLHDFVPSLEHSFSAAVMEASWDNYGSNENWDFVYAPVRYATPFKSRVARPRDLRPSLSVYWFLYRAFKSLGYRIESEFLDSAFFRKLVMPWTWGDFLFTDDDIQAPYLFRRVCTQQEVMTLYAGSWHEKVSQPGSTRLNQMIQWNDVSSRTSGQADGGFEGTAGLSAWVPSYTLEYTYPAGSVLGYTIAGFELQLYYYVYHGGTGNNEWGLYATWFVNGVQHSQDLLKQYSQSGAVEGTILKIKELGLNPGDVVRLELSLAVGDSGSSGSWNWKIGNTYATSQVNNEPPSHLWLRYFKKAVGSPVRFKNFPAFKRYKWLDLLRGVVDCFNLAIQTDPVTKTVYIEPTHEYGSPGAKTVGYLGKGTLDWTEKQDFSKESALQLYSDCEREFDFKFRDDSADGGVALIKKRHSVVVGASRYLLPDRFKAGKKEMENRFFSPVVHVPIEEWKDVTGLAPQLVALVAENAEPDDNGGTGKSEVFEPKLCYYKGRVTGAGGWIWSDGGGVRQFNSDLPFMFAVNYQPGGGLDPVLTYGDQRVGSDMAHGLMRRFYLPRLAIMRRGRLYKTWMKLSLRDVAGGLHREAIAINGKKYYLVGIDKYQPLRDETTSVTLWQWEPLTQADNAACFPSFASVVGSSAPLPSSDLPYTPSVLLPTDVPLEIPE